MADARRVRFGASLLHESIRDLDVLNEERLTKLQHAIAATSDHAFFTKQSICEIIGTECGDDHLTVQLRVTHLKPMVNHETLSMITTALVPNLTNWILQLDPECMNLVLVLLFSNQERGAAESMTEDRCKKRRHRIQAGEPVHLPEAPRGLLGKLYDHVLDTAVAVAADTRWMANISTPQGVLQQAHITDKVGLADTQFVMQFLQSVVSFEPQIPRLFVRLTTKDTSRQFNLEVAGLKRWAFKHYQYIATHYGEKIRRVTYSFDRQYAGIVHFHIFRSSPIETVI